jgi:hypothetical protein
MSDQIVLEQLKRGRAYLMEHNWIRGQLANALDQPEGVCAWGALTHGNMSAYSFDIHNALDTLGAAAQEAHFVPYFANTTALVSYNDLIARDKQDVVSLFDAAIIKLEAKILSESETFSIV